MLLRLILGLLEVSVARVRRHVQRQVGLSLVAPVSPSLRPCPRNDYATAYKHEVSRLLAIKIFFICF